MKMFYEPDRKDSTLLPILLARVNLDTEIWSDEWKGYVNLCLHFKFHRTIKYKWNFIDHNTEVNTELIERF